MQAIPPMIVGFVALTAVSVQAAPSPNQENWGLLGRPLSFTLGDQACGEGWHMNRTDQRRVFKDRLSDRKECRSRHD
jgi:hypothetical protein